MSGLVQMVFAERSTIFGLVLLVLVSFSFAVRMFSGKISAVKWLTLTVSLSLLGYMAGTVPFFVLDIFSIRRALFLEGVAALLFVLVRLLACRKAGFRFAAIDWDLRPHLPLIVLLGLGLAMSWGNFGYFGMGQDQGVYQVKALDLMNGGIRRVTHFEEYDRLETEEEKRFYAQSVFETQAGLDVIDRTLGENLVMPDFVRTEAAVNHNAADGIFHGIPTYPAVLALYGRMAGTENLSGVQTLFYLLAAAVLWLTAENLGLKRWVACAVCLIYLLSPEALWLSKSTLTESALAMVMALFLYFLTNREHPERRWWSAWMAAAFAVLHVSIFVMIHLFAVLYLLLYLLNGDRQYLRGAVISSAGFLLGFTFMAIVAPRYTIRNTAMLWVGPVTLENIYPILMGVGALELLAALILGRVHVRGGLARFIQSAGFTWLLRLTVLGLLGVSALLTVKRIPEAGLKAAVCTNGLYNMAWMTGLVSLPALVLCMVFRPERFRESDTELALTLVFGYAVLLMCCVLKAKIEYCYYYGRYLTPYIPVVCVLAGLMWNRVSGRGSRAACAAAVAAGLLLMLPFDAVLVTSRDDTRSSYEPVTRISAAVSRGNTALIWDRESATSYLLPVRTITGNDSYFAAEDVEEQALRLSERYDSVYYITSGSADWPVVIRLRENASMDDNVSNRWALCPFPRGFSVYARDYTVYRFEQQ